MKIAVLGDVHGNFPAFQAVIQHMEDWGPDEVVLAGDVVNRGPSSPGCLAIAQEKIREQGWQPLIGNHEEYVIHQSTPEAHRRGPIFEAYKSTYWTFRQLGEDVSAFEKWPLLVELQGPGSSFVRVAHASVLGTQQGIFPRTTEADLVVRGGRPAPTVFAAGHTHVAFQRLVGDTHFVNVGAVGVPFDGDTRAGYGQLTWRDGSWLVKIVRISYDREQAFLDCQRTGFLAEAGPLSWLVLAELLFARSQLFAWHRDHFEAVCAGERGMEASVKIQLEGQGMWKKVKEYL